ncbi:MAG: ABC transporter substrate-binding protein [Acetobacteraceae bacterium]|nr:ABC transporter substrate-binding protein [Acetobacteraceae bacterium]
MNDRRAFILVCLASTVPPSIARAADEAARASAFIRETGIELGKIARPENAPDARRAALKSFLDRVVDLPDVARFCAGRFWSQGDQAWRRRYLTLFETVILLNVLNRLGAYRGSGSNVNIGNANPVGDDYEVPTTVRSEKDAPVRVIWRVSFTSGGPRIVDVTAEGISLRVTLRSDFSSYLRQNGNDLNALLGAMERMISGS